MNLIKRSLKSRLMEDIDLDRVLEGENLAFYKNIQDLKKLTSNAKALITRSHAMYKDIVQHSELMKIIKGSEEEPTESIKSLEGICAKCGLLHGAHDYCIVYKIISAENKLVQKQAIPPSADRGFDVRHDSFTMAATDRLPTLPPKSIEVPSEKMKKWEGLLYREMTPVELELAYSKICHRYGFVNGRKFLLARSLARKSNKQVEPKKGEVGEKFASITKECEPQILQRPKIAQTPLVDFEMKKGWRKVLKAKPQSKKITPMMVASFKLSPVPVSSSTSCTEVCFCGLRDCDCCSQSKCVLPQKKCQVLEKHTNYLDTVREKVRKRKLLKSNMSMSTELFRATSSDIKFDSGKESAGLMMKNFFDAHTKNLKNCVQSVVGKDNPNVDVVVQKLAEATAPSKKPEGAEWDAWIGRLHAVGSDGEDTSGDSDIPSNPSVTSTTDQEFGFVPAPSRIPYAKETLQLIDHLFGKIRTKLRNSARKSSLFNLCHPYRKCFISQVDNLVALKGSDNVAREVVDKLQLWFRNFKNLIPTKVLKAQRLKRLNGKGRKLSKTIRRRNLIEGVQLGKSYRIAKKHFQIKQYEKFLGVKTGVLQNAPFEKLVQCDSIRDERNLLSEKNIQHHYKLLRTLFKGTMQSEDKESLMDEGMKERLKIFKKTLRKSAQTLVEKDSSTENEGVSELKSASSFQRPFKREDKKLKSAPGHFSGETRSNRTLPSRINDYGNVSSLFEETHPRIHKSSSSKRITSRSIETVVPTRKISSTVREDFTNDTNPAGGVFSQRSSNRFSRSDRTATKTTSQSVNSQKVTNPSSQWEQSRLPTPPLSESSDDVDCELFQHRVPSKEEAHNEKSARLDVGEELSKKILNSQSRSRRKNWKSDETELTDRSSDSYVPELLKFPPKISSKQASNLIPSAYYKITRARSPYSTDSSSVDPVETRDVIRKRSAWNHQSKLHGQIAPYSSYADQKDTPPSKPSPFSSPLPTAGRSILKKTSLHKPLNDLPMMQVSSGNLARRKSFSDSSYRSMPGQSEVLVRSARVVTERLLKSVPDNLADGRVSSSKKHSTLSRATPEPGPSGKSPSLMIIESKSGQAKALVVPHAPPVPTESFPIMSKPAAEAFRRRSVAPSPVRELPVAKEPVKVVIQQNETPQEIQCSSTTARIKKLEAISPTKRRCFDMDIGQGINCINYLKESAPGADEIRKKELVDLLVTPVEPKKNKKPTVKPEKESSLLSGVGSQLSTTGVPSGTPLVSSQPSKYTTKTQDVPVQDTPLQRSSFKTLDQIYKEIHHINKHNTPPRFVENDYEYETKKKQQLTKHRITP